MIGVTRLLTLLGVALLALLLRTCELGRRPMHADEANQAIKTVDLIEGRGYAYDPTDHHGPTLYYAGALAARLRGERSAEGVTEFTLRLVPATHGVLAVLLLVVFVGRVNRNEGDRASGTPAAWQLPAAALLAGAFLAVTPPAVYYARYYIQETLLVCYLLVATVATQAWWTTGRQGWIALAGAAAGLCLATKESALLFLIAAAAGVGCARPPGPLSDRRLPAVALGIGCALAIALLFFTSFGTHPAGAVEAIRGLVLGAEHAQRAGGHEKPWSYYLQLLTWQRNGGLFWHQLPLAALAVLGVADGLRSRSRLLRGCTGYVAISLTVLSAVPYKTPWNIVPVLPALAVLAAGGLLALTRLGTGRLLAAACGLLSLAALFGQTQRVSFRRSTDPRNPYAYVHSSPDVLKYRAAALAAREQWPREPIRVIADEYWPLPWYLRGLSDVGYWTTPPDACDGGLVIVAADQADAVRARLRGRYTERFLGLRPGFVCILFTRTAP